MEQKKTLSLLNNLKSHPDKALIDHLKNVGNRSREILESKNLNLDNFIDFEILKDISFLIGISHDFGKSTLYFQEYIKEEDESKKAKLRNKPETHHAFVSSIFTYFVVNKYLSKRRLIEKEHYRYLPIISFLIVKRHHGNLDSALDETYDCCVDENEKFGVIKRQTITIDFEKLNIIYSTLCFECRINTNDFKNRYKEIVEEINTKQKRLIRRLDEEGTLFYYFITLLLYSILLDADKTEAANLEIVKRNNISSDVVDKYKEENFCNTKEKDKSKSRINEIRENIYKEAISRVDELDLNNDKILSLNVPTGTGKTLTSLSFALKLRERLSKEKGISPRIIYSLPFLSIIDQNSHVFNDVLNNPTTDILLKHHSLSDIVYTAEDEFENIEIEKDINKCLLLIEGWNSEVIVTTFMQFFYSIVSNKNRAIRKFHNIANSIVLLDEVQAIPHKYWLLLKESIRFLAEHFNTYFVFVTATQPLIFNEKENEIKSLIKNKEDYFEEFDRVDLILKLEPLNIEDFKKELKNNILQNPKKDFLIVMNTINSSKEIYNFLKDEANDKENSKIYYLSANIVPKERLARIKELKQKTKERKIVVSTQLIEAGVDIDVDVVYRDFAPLDSINQVAGRCNRNFRDYKGTVKVFILTEKENGGKYYKYIYDSFIADKTQQVFKDFKTYRLLSESKFLGLNNSYFEKIKEGMSNDESNDILNNVKKLEFAKMSDFKLIKNEPCKVDVFVELDKEAKKIWQEYREIISNDKLKGLERKRKFLKIKKQFYNYVISINKKYAENLTDEKYGIGYVGCNELKSYYDIETGFKRENVGCEAIVI